MPAGTVSDAAECKKEEGDARPPPAEMIFDYGMET